MKRKLVYVKEKWFLCLFLIVAVWFSLFIIFRNMPEIKEEEKLNIFIVSEIVNPNDEEYFLEVMPDGIKEVVIVHSTLESGTLDYLFTTTGAFSSDIFILPKSFIDESSLETFFMPLGDLGYSDYYTEGDIRYGVLVSKNVSDRNLSDYIGFYDEDYYILVNVNSNKSLNTDLIEQIISIFVGGF